MDELTDYAAGLGVLSFVVSGDRSGTPFDILLIASPMKACGGLFLHVGDELSRSQRDWVASLIFSGYQVETAQTIDSAKAEMRKYLS
jgi:hypothetical protein